MSDTAIITPPPVSETVLEKLLQKAVENNVPVESLEKLMTMRRELRAEWSKGEYDKAMSEFQSECPIIKKNKKGYGYFYAPLETIVEQTRDFITKNGFSYAIKTITEPARVKVTCIVRHSAGHSESSEYEVPIAKGTDLMNESQKVASTLTFAKRYAFCNAFGIMTGDDDNDTEKQNPEELLKKQVEEAVAKLKSAVNLNALKGVFSRLSGELKLNTEVLKVANELKAKFQPKENKSPVAENHEPV